MSATLGTSTAAPTVLVHGCAGYAGEPVWLLSTVAGSWVAECGHPGCSWTTTEQLAALVDDVAAGHALTHQTAAGAA